MKPAQKIWLNGKIVPIQKANFLNFHQGLNYGACVYEGIRCYKTKTGPAIFRLKEHIDRFFYSASVLCMNLGMNKKVFAEAIKETVRANKLESGYIRPMAFYSEPKMGINIIGSELTIVVFVWPWRDGEAEKSVSMKIVGTRRLDPSTVDLKAKISGYYANGLLGFLEARKDGFDEPLLLDTKGYIAEGAVNNIFIVKKGTLYTPKLGNILGGITRDSILTIARDMGMNVYEKNMSPEFLRNADEIFLTGTGIELEHVKRVYEYYEQLRMEQPICAQLQGEYRAIIYERTGKHKKWLASVQPKKI